MRAGAAIGVVALAASEAGSSGVATLAANSAAALTSGAAIASAGAVFAATGSLVDCFLRLRAGLLSTAGAFAFAAAPVSGAWGAMRVAAGVSLAAAFGAADFAAGFDTVLFAVGFDAAGFDVAGFDVAGLAAGAEVAFALPALPLLLPLLLPLRGALRCVGVDWMDSGWESSSNGASEASVSRCASRFASRSDFKCLSVMNSDPGMVSFSRK